MYRITKKDVTRRNEIILRFTISYRLFVTRWSQLKVWHLGKAVPLQAQSGPEGSKKLSFPRFRDNSIGRRPPLPPGNVPGTHFC